MFHLSFNFISDLMVRDHNGCSALHYAANTNSFLTEDIIHVLMEALSQKGTHTHTHLNLICLTLCDQCSFSQQLFHQQVLFNWQ